MFDKYIRNFVREASEFLLQKVKDQTPEDTWELQSNNLIIPLTDDWTTVRWGVENRTPYWPFVEYWVNSRSYNYYKNGWRRRWASPFYTWVWARMFTKAEFENGKEIMNIFEKNLNEWIRAFNSQTKK